MTFMLKIQKKYPSYLQHIHSSFDDIELRRRELIIYANTTTGNVDNNGRWKFIPFMHPLTLDMVATEQDLKTEK